VVSENKPVNAFPVTGTSYSANAVWRNGDDLGNGNYVVYNDTGNQFVISSLTNVSTYHISVFEYQQNTATGNYPVYKLCNALESTVSLSTSSIDQMTTVGTYQIFPNPTNDDIQIQCIDGSMPTFVDIHSLDGKFIKRIPLDPTSKKQQLSLRALQNGFYILKGYGDNRRLILQYKFVKS
jgi:hypothetical protein